MPSLSLCLIARDEERFLPRCLASARGVVDEIIVTDTGSRDATPDIARAHGARVVDFPWCDDFAAARNSGLEVATGDWILVLDADEELGPGAAQALARACEDRSMMIGLLPLHDAAVEGAAPADILSGAARRGDPVLVPRLFPGRPELRYRRRVHEQIGDDLGALHAAGLGEIRTVHAPILHYGQLPDVRAARGKETRNRRLLELAVAEDPTDVDLAGYLARELYTTRELDAVVALGKKVLPYAIERLRRAPDLRFAPSPVRLAGVLAVVLLELGRPQEALEHARAALTVCVEPHPNLVFLEGVALQRLGEPRAAIERFERCLALHGHAFPVPLNPGVTGDAARLHLSSALLTSGRAEEALPHLVAVRDPKLLPSAILSSAECHLALGRPDASLQALAPLLEKGLDVPDVFALASAAAEALGAGDPTLAQTAAALPAQSWIEPRRRSLVGG